MTKPPAHRAVIYLATVLALVGPVAAETTGSSDPAASPRGQDRMLAGAFAAEADYRTRLARLQRLLELAIDAGDRVRAEQVGKLRQQALQLGHEQRRAHHARLIDHWRVTYEEQLELASSAVIITAPPTSAARATVQAPSGEETSVFARRRQAARTRIADRRSEQQQRQQAARDAVPVENDFARHRVERREALRARAPGAKPATPTPTKAAAVMTTASDDASGGGEAAETGPERETPRSLLVTHQEAYTRAAFSIRSENAARVFWTLRDAISSEVKARAKRRGRRAAASATQQGGK